jgi:RNA polymerase sigma factor (sigma-70 family)
MNSNDIELLRRYIFERSEAAFADLVRQHIAVVYSAALRQTNGDASLAEDVTQVVFTELARKAARLTRHTSLGGWLYTSTRYAAATLCRAEQRRSAREQEAHAMNQLLQPAETDPAWEQLRPILDEAMHDLKEDDREAVLLRFLEHLPLAAVGARLGVTENTARMRVDRALEKLRGALAKRGVTSTAAALAVILTAQAASAVPAGLAASVSATAIASAAAGSVATLSILKSMTLAKLTLGVTGAVLVGALATFLFREHQSESRLRDENQQLRGQIRQRDQLAVESGRLSNQLAEARSAKEKLSDEQFRELLRLRGEVGVLRRQNAELQAAQHGGKQDEQTAPQEPVFEGKPLTAWLEELWKMTGPRSHESSRSGPGARAVLALGTNAVPYLVHMLTANRPRLSDQPLLSAENEAVFPASYTSATDNVIRAATACELLGPKAGAAIPALIPLLEDPDGALRAQVVAALCFIQQEADRIVPLLAERLADTEPRVYHNAINGLAMFGAKARPALPALRMMAESQYPDISASASSAMRKIENAPEK